MGAALYRIGGGFSWFAFVVLFPAFFFYHLLVAAGAIPMFMGAWWTPWNILACGVLGAAFLGSGRYIEAIRWHVGVVAFLVLVGGYAIFHYLFGLSWQRGPIPMEESAKLIVGIGSLYFVGYFLRHDRWFVVVLLACWSAMAATTIVLMDPDAFAFIASDRFGAPHVASYQWFGQAFALTAIGCMGLVSDWRIRAVVAGASLPVLFLLSSRADLLGVGVVVGVWGLLAVLRYKLSRLVFASASLAAVVAFLLMVAAILPDTARPASNRQLEMLNPAQSGSVIERVALFEGGLEDIIESPLLGIYAGQMRDGGRFGSYMHNVLGAWHNYGFVAFAIYVSLCSAALICSLRWQRSTDGMGRLTFYVAIYSVVLIVVAKSIYWPLPALAWGLVAARSVSAKAAA